MSIPNNTTIVIHKLRIISIPNTNIYIFSKRSIYIQNWWLISDNGYFNDNRRPVTHLKTGKIQVHQDLQKTAWLSHRLWSESGQWKTLPPSRTTIIFPASVSLYCLSCACLLLAVGVVCISALSPSSSPLCHFVSSLFISSALSSPRSVIPHRVSCLVWFSFLFLFFGGGGMGIARIYFAFLTYTGCSVTHSVFLSLSLQMSES